MMGIYLQRSWIIDLITLTILLPVFIFGTQIFSLLGQEQGIAKSGGYISVWFILYVYGLIFSLTIHMYLQAQQKNMIIAWLSTLQFVIHILCSWLFVYVLEFGVAGAMAALHIFMVSCFGRICVHLRGLVPQYVERIQYSCSEGLMARGEALCFIWFDDLVANELGRGDAKALKFSIKVVMSNSVSIGVLFWILWLVFSKNIGYLLTDEEAVVQAISELLVLLAFTVLLGSIYPVLLDT